MHDGGTTSSSGVIVRAKNRENQVVGGKSLKTQQKNKSTSKVTKWRGKTILRAVSGKFCRILKVCVVKHAL